MARKESAGTDHEAAYAHVKAGRIAEAEALCCKILAADPAHAEALHLLGTISAQGGDASAAIELYKRALSARPDFAETHTNLGVVLLEQGEIKQAVGHIGKAIELAPNFAPAHRCLGNAFEAVDSFEEAATAYRRALSLDPGDAETYTDLGDALERLDRVEEAAASYRQALAIDPDHVTALNNLGNALQALGRLDEAVASYRRALMIEPDFAEIQSNLGNALRVLGRLEEAEESLRRAIAAEPDYAMAYSNLGVVLLRQGKADEAVAAFRTAIDLDPGAAMTHNKLGDALKRSGDFEDAAAAFRHAIELELDTAEVHSNLGVVLRDMARYDEAEASLEHALRIDPGYLPAKTNLALLWLVLGDFSRAWEFYTARRSVQNLRRSLYQEPLPDDLSGKRILLLKDQGLGDEIFFLRFAPEVKRRGGEITYLANPKIASIIARLSFIDNVVGEGKEPRGMDITLSAGDLPLVLGMKSAADIPPPYPLPVDPDRGERMVARLEGLGPPPYLGVTWRAGTMNMLGSLFKEAPLADLGRALRPLSTTIVVLQRNPDAGEIDELSRAIGRKVHDLTALNDDLEDMLAALSLLDEYVTVSNTNVHLRAGAGRTSRVLIPHPPEWRWMAKGDESPLFPGCAVYRQQVGGDWKVAFAALSRDLAKAFGT